MRIPVWPCLGIPVFFCSGTHAQQVSAAPEIVLPTVSVQASADASAQGVPPALYPGAPVAQGARIGVWGNQSALETPFSISSYLHELIENQQAKSVGDVLLNDPTVRVARGHGNFQESYFIRGMVSSSDGWPTKVCMACNRDNTLRRNYLSAWSFCEG